jgi:hypothetical protein
VINGVCAMAGLACLASPALAQSPGLLTPPASDPFHAAPAGFARARVPSSGSVGVLSAHDAHGTAEPSLSWKFRDHVAPVQ